MVMDWLGYQLLVSLPIINFAVFLECLVQLRAHVRIYVAFAF